jgi:N-acetylglutamate synthase-like GNAT family acetyltransferase
MPGFFLRPLEPGDRHWVKEFTAKQWRTDFIVAHGEVHYPAELPGFVALEQEERIGLVTYNISEKGCEIVTINSVAKQAGVGTALIEATKAVARQRGCKRVWLITTNDNLDALRFYQRRGFQIVSVARNAIQESRKLKPRIPTIGFYGIPIRDEIELEIPL